MNPVSAGLFSFTPEVADDDGYLRWHLLDHMPEQYQLPGIRLGQRWVADEECRAHRLAGVGPWSDLAGVVNYLVGDPVETTLRDFVDLGRRLGEVGRMPVTRPSIGVAALALREWRAAPAAAVSSVVVPFRPHRGVLLLVEPPGEPCAVSWAEDDLGPLLDVPGVAGLWSYDPPTAWEPPARLRSGPFSISVVYLDDDPLTFATAAAPLLSARWRRHRIEPLFAGPLRSVVRYDAWP